MEYKVARDESGRVDLIGGNTRVAAVDWCDTRRHQKIMVEVFGSSSVTA
jgi:hypothetical protein